jgi:hypothetical protein
MPKRLFERGPMLGAGGNGGDGYAVVTSSY